MVLVVICIVVSALGFHELPAVSDTELNDEVAKAQQRARIMGCVSLARNYVMKTDLSEFIKKHSEQAVKEKIRGDILHSCYYDADQTVLENYALQANQDPVYMPLANHYSFDVKAFASKSINLTQSQVDLYAEISKVAWEPYVPEEEKPYVIRPSSPFKGCTPLNL